MADPTGGDATIAVRNPVGLGSTFADRYEIEKLLGRGGAGAVYRVRDRAVDEVVALKLLDLDAASTDVVDRFRREVRLARRITHRNAARTYDLGEWQGYRYLTMEYVDGESLRELANRIRLGNARIVDIALQIANGLAAVHEAGVVHRDLKPANVLIERSGRVVITDFGIARGMEPADATIQTGGLIGTPAYMAPEQISGEPVDERTDLYALGLILFELFTGRLPFTGDTSLAVALARLHVALPDLRAEPSIPAGLAPILDQLLAREAAQRTPTAKALIDRLTDVAREFAADDPGTLGMSTATGGLAKPVTPGTATPASVTGSPSTSATTRRGRALAVLPFRYRGPDTDRHVAESLTDELIDVLSTMKGLRVSASGATARFADVADRDPRTIGSELEVDAIVDGTVQLSGQRLRIAARLVDVQNGFQLWSERYDGSLEDVFELQDNMVKRIAEALRLELEHIAHRGEAPAEAIDAYLRARNRARNWDFASEEGAVVLYERCLALAPEFKPALGGLAIACVRAWFSARTDPRDWAARAAQAVAEAQLGAPDLAETHLASAMLAVHQGQFRDAATALTQALRIAPTYAAAHDYLGRLQMEAGQPDKGIRHLELALKLDPALTWSLPEIARYHALRDDRAGFETMMRRYHAAAGRDDFFAGIMLEIRVASWFGDLDRVRAAYARLSPGGLDTQAIKPYVDLLLAPEVDGEQILTGLTFIVGSAKNPRFKALVLQVSTEGLTFRGFDDLAMRCLVDAAEGVLIDHDWLERCPLLARLRLRPEYPRVRELVLNRALAIWGV